MNIGDKPLNFSNCAIKCALLKFTKKERFARMSRNILMFDEVGTVRKHMMDALKKVDLIGNHRQAGDGIDWVKVSESLEGGDGNTLPGQASPGRFQIPANGEFPERVERNVLTGGEVRGLTVKGLEYGACEHLPKPFEIGELAVREEVQLKIKELQDELKRSNRVLREFPDSEPPSNLNNRRNRTKIPNNGQAGAKRNIEASFYVIHDIVNFEQVNDNCGDQNGDRVLTNIAEAIRAKRSYDSAAVYGREELGTVNIYA